MKGKWWLGASIYSALTKTSGSLLSGRGLTPTIFSMGASEAIATFGKLGIRDVDGFRRGILRRTRAWLEAPRVI